MSYNHLHVCFRWNHPSQSSGTSGLNFSWEIKAKQKNYESLRLEENMEKVSADYTDEELLLSDIDKWTNSIIEEALNYE